LARGFWRGDIFVSYTSSDREWAEWIGHELVKLGHTPRLHDWEIKSGDDIMAWMVERHDQADFVIGVVSDEWLRAAYSKLERMAAEWAAAKSRPNFMRHVMVRPAKLPTIFLPPGGAARVLITSNAHDWGALAEPIDIRLWPKNIGADFLILRTKRENERADAEALSQALGGLPLAHEQAAAYCERLGVSFGEYLRRFERTPIKFLADARHAPKAHNDGQTVERSFALAIEQAAKLHPMVEPLIFHAALLAPEPIPLYLLEELWGRILLPPAGEGVMRSMTDEGRGDLADPGPATLTRPGSAELPSPTSGRGDAPEVREDLEEAIAALRAFALVDRETVTDEREPSITTDTIRLHRLVREVAKRRRDGEAVDAARRALLVAVAIVYPNGVYSDPQAWPRARRLDALALALVGGEAEPSKGMERPTSYLLDSLAAYRHWALTAYAQARPLYERALAIDQKLFGREHPNTLVSLNNLALLLRDQGNLADARPLFERALEIREKALGAEHPSVAQSLNNLALVLSSQDDLCGARSLLERAVAIGEKTLGPAHPVTAPHLNNLANLLAAQGDFASARPLFEHALAIFEKALDPEHPHTNLVRAHLARLLLTSGDTGGALPLGQAALGAHEKILGPDHPWTKASARVTADAVNALGRSGEAADLRAKFGL
jgi:tetratricopeptide (TPR) repeat protein